MGDKNRHIDFEPMSYGGSIYITTSPNVQKALESHHLFGKRFFLAGVTGTVKPSGKASGTVVKPSGKASGTVAGTSGETSGTVAGQGAEAHRTEPEEAQSESGMKQVAVTDWDDAKNYLKNTFKAKATQIKTHEAVLRYAAEHGVEFVGLE